MAVLPVVAAAIAAKRRIRSDSRFPADFRIFFSSRFPFLCGTAFGHALIIVFNLTLNLNLMATKSNWWDKLLKIVIAVASAVLGALGMNAMPA